MSYRYQALFYQKRKNFKDVRIKLDFTKGRYGILKDAIDLDYVYADVNSQFKVIFKDGSSTVFTDIDNLRSIINDLS